jgi:hypothetical protein
MCAISKPVDVEVEVWECSNQRAGTLCNNEDHVILGLEHEAIYKRQAHAKHYYELEKSCRQLK